MKNVLGLILVSVALLISSTVNAQFRYNIVKTSLTAPLIKTYTIAYERVLNADMSVQLGYNHFAGWKLGDSKLSGYSIIPEFRYYLSESKETPNGGFIAPFGRYGSTSLKILDETDPDYAEADINIIGGGLLVGVQRLFKDVISLEAFIGPAFYSAKLDVKEGDVEESNLTLIDGWSVRLGITIGIAF